MTVSLRRGGIGLEKAINKERKDVPKGYSYLEVLRGLFSGLEHVSSGLRINGEIEHRKDCLSLPSDPGHPLEVLIFLTVTGFCETLYLR